MMKELIWAEHQKLRRSKIVLVAIFAVIMVAIIVFTQGQFSFGEKRYIDDAGWFMNAAQSLLHLKVTPSSNSNFFCSSCGYCTFGELYDLS